MAIYYLKMYYGNIFEYNFWRRKGEDEMTLTAAIKNRRKMFLMLGIRRNIFEKLFSNNLSCCMEILPLAYEYAAICAKQTSNEALYNYYNSLTTELYNEHNINVTGYYYTGHLYDE
jgi:hypothetical protein